MNDEKIVKKLLNLYERQKQAKVDKNSKERVKILKEMTKIIENLC
jgi:flagellin-specific chaperone FliS